MIFFTTSSGCTDGKKNRYRGDVEWVTVENMDVCTCPGSTSVVLMSGHWYLRDALAVSRTLEGYESVTSHRVHSVGSHATRLKLLWKHSSRLHGGGVGRRPGKGR